MTAAADFVIGFPILLWLALMILIRGRRVELDYAGNQSGTVGTFSYFLGVYHRIFWVVFSLSLSGALAHAYARRPFQAVFFTGAAVYALLFNFLITVFFESYMHSKYPLASYRQGTSNYSAWKYGMVITTALSAGLLFVIGLLMTVVALLER